MSDLSIDREMLRSMATSFRARMGFSFNADDMADLLDRCADLVSRAAEAERRRGKLAVVESPEPRS